MGKEGTTVNNISYLSRGGKLRIWTLETPPISNLVAGDKLELSRPFSQGILSARYLPIPPTGVKKRMSQHKPSPVKERENALELVAFIRVLPLIYSRGSERPSAGEKAKPLGGS